MAFKFRLEKLLDYKETIEGLKKSEYGEKISKLDLEEKKLKEIVKKRQDIKSQKMNEGETFSVLMLRSIDNYLYKLEEEIMKQEKVVEQCIIERDKAQEELIKAMQEKKAFEKLKERDFEEFIEETKKKEDKIADEIVTFRGNRQ